MGLSRREEERVKQALTDALTNLCRTNLTFNSQLCVEGLLGITLDETDVVLVKIDETLRGENQRNSRNTNGNNAESDTSGKRGRKSKGKTRSRGRGRQASSRKRTHSPENMQDIDEVPTSRTRLESDDNDGCGMSDDEQNNQDIKEEPEDSKETKSIKDSEEKLDSETSKNLNSFLHNLISAHGTENAEETSSSTKRAKVQTAQPKSSKAKNSGWTPPVKVPKSMRLPREITGPIKRKLYPESAIKEAIRLVKEEKYSMRSASLATGCPPSTLHRRFFQEELKTSGKKPLLTPHGEETLCNYIKMRMTSGQKVTSSWAMGLAAILAKNDGIEFNTQHGGPSFGWWMRFKTRHPELGLLNSPNKEAGQSTSTVAPQSGLVQSPVLEASPNVNTNEKKDILHVAAADAIGSDVIVSEQDREKQVYLEKQLTIESHHAQTAIGKEMELSRQVALERQMSTDRPEGLEMQISTDKQTDTERQQDGLNYIGGQIYY